MIFRSVVNVPGEGVCEGMVGSIPRVYRDAFGLAQNTLRVYQILGVKQPDHRLWATIIVEMLTALKSQNFVLRNIRWQHYTDKEIEGGGGGRLDADVRRI